MRKDRAMAEALRRQGSCGKSIRSRTQSHEPKRSTRPKAPDYFAGLRGPDGPARTANVQLDMVRVRRKTARSARPLAGDGCGVKHERAKLFLRSHRLTRHGQSLDPLEHQFPYLSGGLRFRPHQE